MFVSPMPRSQGIFILRKFLQASSPDACLVSSQCWSTLTKSDVLELGTAILCLESRMAQGHRRTSGACQKVSLYGRDGVHTALGGFDR